MSVQCLWNPGIQGKCPSVRVLKVIKNGRNYTLFLNEATVYSRIFIRIARLVSDPNQSNWQPRRYII